MYTWHRVGILHIVMNVRMKWVKKKKHAWHIINAHLVDLLMLLWSYFVSYSRM